jgi:hypothetical protein
VVADDGYGFFHRFDGGDFITHQADRFRSWANENQTTFFDLLGKIGPFSQKAIAWVNGLGIGHFGSCNQRRDIQITLW